MRSFLFFIAAIWFIAGCTIPKGFMVYYRFEGETTHHNGIIRRKRTAYMSLNGAPWIVIERWADYA